MAEAVAFADAEAVAVSWLNGKLGGVKVSTKVPNPRPAQLVRVTRTGGVRRDLISDNAQLTFECWALDSVAASTIARTARAWAGALEGETVLGAFVYKVVEVGGPAYFPDPETDLPRYQFTVNVASRGAAI